MDTVADGMPAIAYSLLDAAGEVIAEREPNLQFYAASTIKLAVLFAAALDIDAGRLSFEEPVVCRHQFESAIAGSPRFAVAEDDRDPDFPDDGTIVPMADLLDMMITRSSNEATNLVVARIGLPVIADALLRSGTRGTIMERLIGDRAAIAAGHTNLVTAADLTVLMRCVAMGGLTAPGTTAFMRSVLGRQQYRRITAALPAGVAWGSKSGNVAGIVHDVAFVGEPDSQDARYLAVCTRGYGDKEGQEIIGAIAQSLEVSPLMPSPLPSERRTVSATYSAPPRLLRPAVQSPASRS